MYIWDGWISGGVKYAPTFKNIETAFMTWFSKKDCQNLKLHQLQLLTQSDVHRCGMLIRNKDVDKDQLGREVLAQACRQK